MRVQRDKKIKINGVFGIATNDADYQARVYNDRKIIWMCPYYLKWRNMLQRCYSPTEQKRNPTYIGCTVCEEWLLFSNFRSWMETQDWEGKDLDKDILFIGNKVYSPEACVFIHERVNSFTLDRVFDSGDHPLGVRLDRASGRFVARCSNPFTLRREHLGYFNCSNEAHQAWKRRKNELAIQLADSSYVDDIRVANALKVRYNT
jgi:hypothetical protein